MSGALTLRSRRFREEREADWRRLERLLDRAEGGRAAKLSDEELIAMPVLYRAALSSLSVARATSLDRDLLDYLESLCARAYFFVYGPRTRMGERVARFFARDWPRAAQALWRETLVSLALTLLGAAVAFWLVSSDADWFYAFTPQGMTQGRDPTADTAFLRGILYDESGRGWLSAFATFLFTHNAQVALMAFALGFAFGVPTAFLVLVNGCMLGAIFALYAARGLGVQLGGWIFIHGVTELLAIVLAAAGGFRIGWTLAFPGARTRTDALGEAGRQAATLMMGVLAMLFVAGLLEGIGRQVIKADAARYTIAGLSLCVWIAYLYLPRGRTAPS